MNKAMLIKALEGVPDKAAILIGHENKRLGPEGKTYITEENFGFVSIYPLAPGPGECVWVTLHGETSLDTDAFKSGHLASKELLLMIQTIKAQMDEEAKGANAKPPLLTTRRLTPEGRKEFEKLCDPLIKFLCMNFHPHVEIKITPDSAHLSEGVEGYTNINFIQD